MVFATLDTLLTRKSAGNLDLHHTLRMDSTLYPSKRPPNGKKFARKRTRVKTKIKKRDPLLVDGKRPRPMYVDYKDVELLSKLVNRHGRIVSRRKSGCSATSQHAVAEAIKRARFMALMPYVGD
jgi:small subunit ribosomal protein S18